MDKVRKYALRLKNLGINTYKEAVIYLSEDSEVCRAEGFEAQTRINVAAKDRNIIATLNTIHSKLLTREEAGLSEYASQLLGVKEGDELFLSHPKPLDSLSFIHSKVYGNDLLPAQIHTIIEDVLAGRLSDLHIASFLTACAARGLNSNEISSLTKSMIQTGESLTWPQSIVVDKHCVGGVPGNRTSLIIVPIVADFGLTIPKTSSRAITSPSGTADTMEVFAPVELDLTQMRKVVEQENGCLVWGGSVSLSPTDDILIRIERVLDLDSEGQMVASVLSKKIAVGSTHTLIDMPIGTTAKVRSMKMANLLKEYLEDIGRTFNINIKVAFTDGTQPVGFGIGPALEALDVMAVLQNQPQAPKDLRDRALALAGDILEFSSEVSKGTGRKIAEEILASGRAWKKFQAICMAQGGLREPKVAKYKHTIISHKPGCVFAIDNRQISQIAKLAGAPRSKGAGSMLHVKIGEKVEKEQPLYTIYAETKGELDYALTYLHEKRKIVYLEEK